MSADSQTNKNIVIPTSILNTTKCVSCDKCIICNGGKLDELINLGYQPLANDYHKLGETSEYYPLKLMLCGGCEHTQLSHHIDPSILFSRYQYMSGTSETIKEYFRWLAIKIKSENPQASSVLELACNDGSQLDIFKEFKWDTIGVDPAENIVSQIKNHKIYNMFFNAKTAETITEKIDIILAQNVLAHTNNPHSFIEGCKKLMNNNTVLYIQTSQCNMFIKNEFDTIYHEHYSFFTEKSMNTLLSSHGLYIQKMEIVNIHGDSFLFTVKLNEREFNSISKIPLFEEYKKNVYNILSSIAQQVDTYKNNGYKIIGYGASAKGNTMLNYTKIKLDYILDDQKSKWELYTPGMNIVIKNPKYIENEKGKILVIALTWNFLGEILNKLRYLTKDSLGVSISILTYFPTIKIQPLDKQDNFELSQKQWIV